MVKFVRTLFVAGFLLLKVAVLVIPVEVLRRGVILARVMLAVRFIKMEIPIAGFIRVQLVTGLVIAEAFEILIGLTAPAERLRPIAPILPASLPRRNVLTSTLGLLLVLLLVLRLWAIILFTLLRHPVLVAQQILIHIAVLILICDHLFQGLLFISVVISRVLIFWDFLEPSLRVLLEHLLPF